MFRVAVILSFLFVVTQAAMDLSMNKEVCKIILRKNLQKY